MLAIRHDVPQVGGKTHHDILNLIRNTLVDNRFAKHGRRQSLKLQMARAGEIDDNALLRNILEDVELGWEGHVLAGNVEHADRGGNREDICKVSDLYALWETSQRDAVRCAN